VGRRKFSVPVGTRIEEDHTRASPLLPEATEGGSQTWSSASFWLHRLSHLASLSSAGGLAGESAAASSGRRCTEDDQVSVRTPDYSRQLSFNPSSSISGQALPLIALHYLQMSTSMAALSLSCLSLDQCKCPPFLLSSPFAFNLIYAH